MECVWLLCMIGGSNGKAIPGEGLLYLMIDHRSNAYGSWVGVWSYLPHGVIMIGNLS